MSLRKKQQAATRRAILSALGEQIAESGTMGFSIQDVARRAGVTHRTVYNHFATREDLNNALADHVEDELHQVFTPPDPDASLARLPELVAELFPVFQAHEASCRAYAMLMVASRAPARVMDERSRRFEAMAEAELGPLAPGQARAITAALRMFASTLGWHLLTEQHGLSGEAAADTAAWATRVLLDAVRRGDRPNLERHDASDDDR